VELSIQQQQHIPSWQFIDSKKTINNSGTQYTAAAAAAHPQLHFLHNFPVKENQNALHHKKIRKHRRIMPTDSGV
jgi:hypothetical protein